MKKLLFAALSVAAFGTAGAQTFDNASASTNLIMNVDDVITINASEQTMTANFSSADNFHWGRYFEASSTPTWSTQNVYTVQSNRYYNVTMSLAPITYTGTQGYSGNNTNMLPGVIRYYFNNSDNNTGGTKAFTAGSAVFTAFNTPVAVLNNCPNTLNAGGSGATGTGNANTGKTFALSFLASPGWAYAGGVYETSITMTATQE